MTLAARCRLLAAAALVLASCAGPADDPAPRVRGPLPTRIQHPVALVFPAPRPRRAHLLEPGTGRATADLAYSSIFERRAGSTREVSFDGEIARLALRLAYGIAPGLEIVVEPALVFGSSGLLDQIVDEFHRATGFVEGGRDLFPRDSYSMRLRNDGRTAFELEEDRVLLGDLPVTGLAVVREEDARGPAIAARVTLEIPTGDEARGSGSGGWDSAAGILVERSIGRWTWTGSLDGILVDRPDAFADAGIDVGPILLVAGGVEYRWSDRTSLLGQALLQSPLTDDVPAEEIDREILDIGIGIAHDLTRDVTFMFAFHEDAVAAAGPDLTFYFGLSTGF